MRAIAIELHAYSIFDDADSNVSQVEIGDLPELGEFGYGIGYVTLVDGFPVDEAGLQVFLVLSRQLSEAGVSPDESVQLLYQ